MRKLHNKKDGSPEEHCKQIEKAKTLVKLSPGEVERLKGRPHHYTLHGIVYKPDSISTSVRLVNNTSVIAKAETTTISIECPAVAKFINKLESCLIHFLLYHHPLAADLAFTYRQMLVDEQTSYLRLCVWFDEDDMPGCQDPIIMRILAADSD